MVRTYHGTYRVRTMVPWYVHVYQLGIPGTMVHVYTPWSSSAACPHGCCRASSSPSSDGACSTGRIKGRTLCAVGGSFGWPWPRVRQRSPRRHWLAGTKVRTHVRTYVQAGRRQWHHAGTGSGGLRRGQSGKVSRPRQLHPVHPGDRWTRQQSGPRLTRHSRAGRTSAQPGRPPVEPADADDHHLCRPRCRVGTVLC
jgi:hypothetical protein